jgi:Pentatricopeptide repeat domain/PPR repeat
MRFSTLVFNRLWLLATYLQFAEAFQPTCRRAPRTLLLRTQQLAATSSVSTPDHLSATDFSLDDFEETITAEDHADDDTMAANVAAAKIVDEDVSVLDFLDMIEQTISGKLQNSEVELVREILSSVDVSEPAGVLERLLFRWVDEWNKRSSSCIPAPTTQDFVSVMRAYDAQLELGSEPQTRRNTPCAVEHVLSLLTVLEDLYDASHDSTLQPNADVFRIVLQTMAATPTRSSSRELRDIDRHAERIFHSMQQEYRVEPDASMYESLIHMLATSRNNGAANRAERLLREAVTRFPQPPPQQAAVTTTMGGSSSGAVGINSFNVVLTAWAKSGMEYGPERAEKLMVLMDEIGIQPSVRSFTSLIDAYSQTNTWDGASHCERIFNRVLDMYVVDDDESFEPSVVSWTVVMSAWARLSKKGFKGAGERADRLLRRMEALHADGRIRVGPDHIVYVTCMNANAFAKTAEGLARAKEILDEMNERYMDGNNDSFKPTARSIRVLIDCWIRSSLPDKMDEAERVLECYKDHLESLGPPNDPPDTLDVVTEIYKSMVFGWTQDGDPILAQQYLQEMVDRGLEPDSFCFDKVIEANTQLNDPGAMKRSYEVFQLLDECRVRGDVVPNERVYTSFIRAMIKARVPGLARKANAILNRMQDLYQSGNKRVKPTVFTYNAVLLACAESKFVEEFEQSSKEALKVAVTIFNELRSESVDEPDHVSFGNMLRCSNLLPLGSQKDALVTSIFQLCCQRGFVNQFILRDLRLVASDEVWKSLLGCKVDDEVAIEQLPASWRRATTRKPSITKPKRSSTATRTFRR